MQRRVVCCAQAAGEEAVKAEFPGATIIRPSVMIGNEDKLFNYFASAAKKLPFVPLIDGGETKLQPV